MKNFTLIDARDIIVFGGLFLMGYGTWLVYQPAAFFLVGAGLWWLGVRQVGHTEEPRK